jgi:hypothetical protein
MKIKLLSLGVVTVVALGLINCRKESSLSVNPTSGNEAIKRSSQKTYNANQEQTVSAILRFKAQCEQIKNPQSDARYTFTHALDVDSATWQLEAVLNYDFDWAKDHDSTFYTVDTLVYPTTVTLTTASKISVTDLSNVYDAFTNTCSALTATATGDSIRVVDLVSSTSTAGVTFTAYVVLITETKPAYPYVPGCNAFTNECARWSDFYSIGYGCTGSGDAPTLMNNRLNCANINGHGCTSGYIWYTDVVNTGFYGGGNGYPSALFYNYSAGHCYNTLLCATSLNNYVSGCQTLASNNLPNWIGNPPYYTVAYYNVTPLKTTVDQTNYWKFWNMGVTYGRGFCSRQQYP